MSLAFSVVKGSMAKSLWNLLTGWIISIPGMNLSSWGTRLENSSQLNELEQMQRDIRVIFWRGQLMWEVSQLYKMGDQDSHFRWYWYILLLLLKNGYYQKYLPFLRAVKIVGSGIRFKSQVFPYKNTHTHFFSNRCHNTHADAECCIWSKILFSSGY